MTGLDVVAIALILLAISDWIWTVILLLALDESPEPALQERAVAGIILSTIATGAAILGLARLHILTVPNDVAIGILAGALILVSAPQWVWGIGLLLGRFR